VLPSHPREVLKIALNCLLLRRAVKGGEKKKEKKKKRNV
jgi:hypothetical protein